MAPDAGPRRRGENLIAAIHQAAIEEVAETGLAGLTVEAIAARAGTGKASLYRRWPSKEALLLDALDRAMPVGAAEWTGDLRTDLLGALRAMAEFLTGPAGPLMRAVMAAVIQDEKLAAAFAGQFFGSRLGPMRERLRAGATRAEVIDSPIAYLGPELVLFRFLTHTGPVDEEYLTTVVDDIVLPLLRPPAEERVRELEAALAEAHLELRRTRS
ncbi:TetR family transcriptional regulator [Herbihabitans rhizosphaerae]|uniref:TetR family transcriptional regulator n=1 Tax=Herbihabitans rhizosphaerae TaxID=1872711 RepID=A0A4V2ESJ0_9PSEU|nr:TetR/AcrR family transcriptional regulator [Herbihabitans rhizosphaerae]RZS37743.1 TetR family transcriptional regulator [Herbihabitans rhizosphaerae]